MIIANAGGCWGNWRELNAHPGMRFWVGLLGVHIYLQAYAFAPGVNPLQIVISYGIDWLLGNV